MGKGVAIRLGKVYDRWTSKKFIKQDLRNEPLEKDEQTTTKLDDLNIDNTRLVYWYGFKGGGSRLIFFWYGYRYLRFYEKWYVFMRTLYSYIFGFKLPKDFATYFPPKNFSYKFYK